MKPVNSAIERVLHTSARVALGVTFLLMPIVANAQAAESNTSETRTVPTVSETIPLHYMTAPDDAREVLTDLRNMLPQAKLYLVIPQGLVSIRATPEDVASAKKLLNEIDRPKKIYRITYTLTEMDGAQRLGSQHLSMVLLSGEKTTLKQGTRVPIVTGTTDREHMSQSSQVQYVDVGLSIDAHLDGTRLVTKIERSGIADEKSNVGIQDPIVSQTMLEAMAILTPGKPVVLGSLDVPGTTRHEQIEVNMEAID